MAVGPSPTARALLALELLQARPGITAAQLGVALEVSERAARRYVGILREAGIPVDATRGSHGGFRVGRGLRLPPLVFTSAEALGLVMAVLDGHHAASDPTDLIGGALRKIVRALPEPVAAQAEAVRRATAAAPDHAAVRPDPRTTTALVQACSERRRARIVYLSGSGSVREFEVDPWAVVVRHGRWYLLCWAHHVGESRALRIDRVIDVGSTDIPASSPADLDPVTALEEHLAVGWEFTAEVVIDAPADRVTPGLPRVLGRVEPDGSRCRLIGTTSNPFWYAEQLAALPAPFRVIGGPELQDAVRRTGQRLLDAVRADAVIADAVTTDVVIADPVIDEAVMADPGDVPAPAPPSEGRSRP